MSSVESKIEAMKSILNNITAKYEKRINEINQALIYKRWAFPGDYQKLLSIEDLKTMIEKYNLYSIDPRSVQDFIDSYNDKEWFRWFPVFNQNGKMSWANDSDVTEIISEFLKTGSKNNSENIFKFINKDNSKLDIIAAAIVWNKLDFIARTVNKYSYRPKLFEGIYEDGSVIGSLARNNKDESLEVICLSNILSTIRSFVEGKVENVDILRANPESLKASCNRQFNKIDVKNISFIIDFWNANVGKKYLNPFEALQSQKELNALQTDQQNIENEMVNALKTINFTNATLSICNMNQNIAGAILAMGESNSIKFSQSCTQTNSTDQTLSEQVSDVTNNFNSYMTETNNSISEINQKVSALDNSSFPVIVFDYSDRFNSFSENLFKKYDKVKILLVVAAIILFSIGMVFLFSFLTKFDSDENSKPIFQKQN